MVSMMAASIILSWSKKFKDKIQLVKGQEGPLDQYSMPPVNTTIDTYIIQ